MNQDKPRAVNALRAARKGCVDTGTARGCKPRTDERPLASRTYTTDSTAGLKPASYWH